MSNKHTPTPWAFGHSGTDALWIGPNHIETAVAKVPWGYDEARHNARENAAFIVRAVNTHDELVEALETHAEWSRTEKEGPQYPEGITRTSSEGETIWKEWWENQLYLCDKAIELTRKALEKAGAK